MTGIGEIFAFIVLGGFVLTFGLVVILVSVQFGSIGFIVGFAVFIIWIAWFLNYIKEEMKK